MSGTVHVERDGAVGVLVIDNPPVNAGSASVREALLAGIQALEADREIAAVVLIGAGRSFIAGSDLTEFDLPLTPPQLPDVIRAVEGSQKPYVAALHGAALGGGYELALACDARIAAPGTSLGLPETTLGIIPGAGGTQKLPRLTGIVAAIDLIAAGRRIDAAQALELGMIDAVAGPESLRAEAVALALSLNGAKRRVIDRKVPKEDAEKIEAAAKKALKRARPHVVAAIAHVRASADTPPATALAAERADFERLRVGDEARALRHVFFAEREAARGRAGRDARPARIGAPGVLGAGTMGAGIATAMAMAGYRVVLVDSDAAALDRAKERITALLARGGAPDGAQNAIAFETDLAALAGCDLVVEAIVEDIEAKRAVFARLDEMLDPDAIIATNTSYLDIDAIAAATQRPGRVIGLHFFGPAHVMKLVEVVPGRASTDAAMATGLAFARALGKLPVEAGNGFGFIGNRIYAAYRAACEFMLEDGALPHEVDAALEEFGFAMGPFAVADLSGLDIAWRMRRQQAATRDPATRYVAIPDRLCEAGRLGRKTGAGYYRYDGDGRRQRDPEVEALIVAEAEKKGIARHTLDAETIRMRALAAIVNEAGLVLEDGIAARSADIDVVLVNGYGFPRWRGGPLYWAASEPPQEMLAACRDFIAACGAGRRTADLAGLGLVPSPATTGA